MSEIQNQTRPVPLEDLELLAASRRAVGWSSSDRDAVAGAVKRVVSYALDQPTGDRIGALTPGELDGALAMAAQYARNGLHATAPAGVPWALIAIELIKLLIQLRN